MVLNYAHFKINFSGEIRHHCCPFECVPCHLRSPFTDHARQRFKFLTPTELASTLDARMREKFLFVFVDLMDVAKRNKVVK